MNKQILDSINRNKYLVYLNNNHLDLGRLKDPIIQSVDEDELQLFANRTHQLLSPNVYVESLVFQHVCEFLYENYKDSEIFVNEAKLDIKTIIATAASSIQRPNIMKPTDALKGFAEPDRKDDFVIISRFERELITSASNWEGVQGKILFSGLLPIKVDVNPLIDRVQSQYIWTNEYYVGEPFIQGFNRSINSIDAQYVLWINSELLFMLGLTLDNYTNGLRALNNNNEVVLEFRCWREQLIGNGASFVGQDSNIAKLEGCDLILREDYFDKLKLIIPEVVYYTEII